MAARFSCTPLFPVVLALIVFAQAAAAAEKAPPAPALKVHPKVFSLVQGWLSDGVSPVVTEINLDAVATSRNQFESESVKQEEEWTRCAGTGGEGFLRYRVLAAQGQRYKIEYQENGGGSLTTSAIIECDLAFRAVTVNGAAVKMRVLRVVSYREK